MHLGMAVLPGALSAACEPPKAAKSRCLNLVKLKVIGAPQRTQRAYTDLGAIDGDCVPTVTLRPGCLSVRQGAKPTIFGAFDGTELTATALIYVHPVSSIHSGRAATGRYIDLAI